MLCKLRGDIVADRVQDGDFALKHERAANVQNRFNSSRKQKKRKRNAKMISKLKNGEK